MKQLSLSLLLLVTLVFVSGSILFAQTTDECPSVLTTVLENVQILCTDLSRNQVCYGNTLVEVEPNSDTDLKFIEPGDLADLADIHGLNLEAYDETLETWGIALFKVQANLPDTLPGQNVSLIAFGDVSISDFDPTMSAFYFKSGIGQALCATIPASGLMVTTAAGTADIQFTVNGVDVEMGSTLFITAQASETMDIALIEGHATLTAEGESVELEPGQQSSIPMTAELEPAGPPTEPEAFEELPAAGLYDTLHTSQAADVKLQEGTWSSTITQLETCFDMVASSLRGQVTFVDFSYADDSESLITKAANEGSTLTFNKVAPGVWSAQIDIITMTLTAYSETSAFVRMEFADETLGTCVMGSTLEFKN